MSQDGNSIQEDLDTYKMLCAAYWKKRTMVPLGETELSQADAVWALVGVMIRIAEILKKA